jgi:hypothetical protein
MPSNKEPNNSMMGKTYHADYPTAGIDTTQTVKLPSNKPIDALDKLQRDFDNQSELVNFVNDPETIRKAAEGSMEKRNKVMGTPSQADELQDIDEYFHYIRTCLYCGNNWWDEVQSLPTTRKFSLRVVDKLNSLLE